MIKNTSLYSKKKYQSTFWETKSKKKKVKDKWGQNLWLLMQNWKWGFDTNVLNDELTLLKVTHAFKLLFKQFRSTSFRGLLLACEEEHDAPTSPSNHWSDNHVVSPSKRGSDQETRQGQKPEIMKIKLRSLTEHLWNTEIHMSLSSPSQQISRPGPDWIHCKVTSQTSVQLSFWNNFWTITRRLFYPLYWSTLCNCCWTAAHALVQGFCVLSKNTPTCGQEESGVRPAALTTGPNSALSNQVSWRLFLLLGLVLSINMSTVFTLCHLLRIIYSSILCQCQHSFTINSFKLFWCDIPVLSIQPWGSCWSNHAIMHVGGSMSSGEPRLDGRRDGGLDQRLQAVWGGAAAGWMACVPLSALSEAACEQ